MTSRINIIPLNLPETPQLVNNTEKDGTYEEFRLLYQTLNTLNDFYTSHQYGTPIQNSNDFANSPFYTTPQVTVECVESIPANRLVHLRIDSGKVVAYLADSAIRGRFANAVSVSAANVNERVRVQIGAGLVRNQSGLLNGLTYFLGSAGNPIDVLPSTTAFVQPVGFGVSSTFYYFKYHPPFSV